MRLRWPIVAAWLAVMVVGFWASGRLSSLQSNVFTVPGTDAEHVRSVLQHSFGDRSDGAFFAPLARLEPQGARVYLGAIHSMGTFARRLAVARCYRPGNTCCTATSLSTLDLAGAKTRTDDLVRAIGQPVGTRAYVTGARRSSTTSTRSSAGTWRRASRSPPIALVDPPARLRTLVGGADPVPVRGQHGAGDALARLCDRRTSSSCRRMSPT
jgi:hypothetical protein